MCNDHAVNVSVDFSLKFQIDYIFKKEKTAPGSGLNRKKKKKVSSKYEGNPFYEAFRKNGVVD